MQERSCSPIPAIGAPVHNACTLMLRACRRHLLGPGARVWRRCACVLRRAHRGLLLLAGPGVRPRCAFACGRSGPTGADGRRRPGRVHAQPAVLRHDRCVHAHGCLRKVCWAMAEAKPLRPSLAQWEQVCCRLAVADPCPGMLLSLETCSRQRTPSAPSCIAAGRLVAGAYTATDHEMLAAAAVLQQYEGRYIEPSCGAALLGLARLAECAAQPDVHADSSDGATASAELEYCQWLLKHGTHVVWATGGAFVPQHEREGALAAGEDALRHCNTTAIATLT